MASRTTLEICMDRLKQNKTYQNSTPKIQKLPEFLRNRNNFEKQYSPKFVSIGPIHLDNPNLQLGEQYKLTWAAKYIQDSSQCPEILHQKIADKIHPLMALFADDVLALANTAESLKDFPSLEEKLSWLLFLDGCSLLYILMNANVHQLDEPKRLTIKVDEPEHLNMMNANVHQLDEPEHLIIKVDEPEHLNMKVYQLFLLMMDVLLLENQLPYLVLKLLWRNEDENQLITTMTNFLYRHHKYKETQPPTHLLDLWRKMLLPTTKKPSRKYFKRRGEAITYRNIRDLTAVGINLKSSETRGLTDVDFSEGWFAADLILPEIIVDVSTFASLLNLVAYEMCPDFENDYGVCSYAVFINSLIDHAEDVRKLKSVGILVNSLGSDEEIANIFNILTTDLVPNPETYYDVRAKIDQYHRKKWKIWIALGYHTYFNNPWAITGFLAAFIALALTSIQTWFSIFPR